MAAGCIQKPSHAALLKVEPLRGGTAAEVYRAERHNGERWVVKFGTDLNALRVEQIFLRAWAKTGVRTPNVFHSDVLAAESSPAYLVMEYVSGENLFPLMEAESVPCNEIERDLGRIAARMHAVTASGYGTVRVGPDGQIFGTHETLADSFRGQEWQEAIHDNLVNGDLTQQETALVTQAASFLDRQRQKERSSYTHNDFRAGNILYDPTHPQPYVVIDPAPELTHPYLCLAYSLILTEIHGRIDPSHFRRGYAELAPIADEALRAALFLRALKLLPRWGRPGQPYAERLHYLFRREKNWLLDTVNPQADG